jgi:Fe-S cluster assembly protein SufD
MKEIEFLVTDNEQKILPFVFSNDTVDDIKLRVRLTGDNSAVQIICIYYGIGRNLLTFQTDVTHEGKGTRSLTFIRAVCKEHAAFSNDGMVRMLQGAKNANGYFDSKVLLFDDAKGRSVPSLEIDENEITKAGHGSTIGRPDELQLFYMQSRGLSEKESQQLIISGFFYPAIQMLPDKDKKALMSNKLFHI